MLTWMDFGDGVWGCKTIGNTILIIFFDANKNEGAYELLNSLLSIKPSFHATLDEAKYVARQQIAAHFHMCM